MNKPESENQPPTQPLNQPSPASEAVGSDNFSIEQQLALTFDERVFAELKEDPAFLRTRNFLLINLFIGGAALTASAWFMFAKVLTVMDLVFVIAAFIWVMVVINRRLNRMRDAVAEKLRHEDDEKIKEAEYKREYEQALAEYYQRQAEKAQEQTSSS